MIGALLLSLFDSLVRLAPLMIVAGGVAMLVALVFGHDDSDGPVSPA